jgi:hypothetical protein
MRDDVFNAIGVIRDRKVEAPTPVDSRLPQIPGLIEFFARSDGCWMFPARNRNCFSKARRTAGGASVKASMARSDKTISIA